MKSMFPESDFIGRLIRLDHNTIVPLIHVFTNFLAIVPIYLFYVNEDYFGMILTIISFVTTFFVHISDHNHNLNGFQNYFSHSEAEKYAYIANFVAICLGIYISSICTQWHKFFLYATIGLSSAFIGEKTKDIRVYTIFHTVWHYCAYIGMADIIISC